MKEIKFIDLFAGMGGIRLGFEQAFNHANFKTKCILTSEIKPSAIEALKNNFEHDNFSTDVTKIDINNLEDFDFLLAGFPCQAFSSAGNRDGFCDARGTLFFEVEKILKEKRPYGFILENVKGLVKDDLKNKDDEIGQTLEIIIKSLENLKYKVNWKVLDSQDFGLAQSRERIYIVGTLDNKIELNEFKIFPKIYFKDIQEFNKDTMDTDFTKKLLSHLPINELYGKAIKDKRGGNSNIHSWDFGLKGEILEIQRVLLTTLLKERRKKHWAEKIGIDWMDGMPLTLEQIETFFQDDDLENNLDDLVKKGYLRFEHPKAKIDKVTETGSIITRREQDITKPKGYNIVSGKLSFEFSKILDPNNITPTLVASDVEKLGVIDGEGIRRLSLKEGLRLFGYPESYSLDIFDKDISSRRKGFDLLGNTVAVPVIHEISKKLVTVYISALPVAV